ncbi:YgaP family membrane protein [Tellurirhabdus rosea]|uniref:YgaP family membrane protein n=1 Tax=Tellurirhabdus rosea TaxID=2674997 RepID=UPI00225AD393|nr:DUF2892 domain-containing protein [Tellurirhabdus rosea]
MNLLRKNVGLTDRLLRLMLALLIGAAGMYYQNWLGILALVPLLTALVGFCPLYTLFGINTCPFRPKAGSNR